MRAHDSELYLSFAGAKISDSSDADNPTPVGVLSLSSDRQGRFDPLSNEDDYNRILLRDTLQILALQIAQIVSVLNFKNST